MTIAYLCEDCGSPKINTKSGFSCCSMGCGKLGPKIPTKRMRINEAILLGIPEVDMHGGMPTVDGVRVEAGNLYTKPVSEYKKYEYVVAIDGDNLRKYNKFKKEHE